MLSSQLKLQCLFSAALFIFLEAIVPVATAREEASQPFSEATEFPQESLKTWLQIEQSALPVADTRSPATSTPVEQMGLESGFSSSEIRNRISGSEEEDQQNYQKRVYDKLKSSTCLPLKNVENHIHLFMNHEIERHATFQHHRHDKHSGYPFNNSKTQISDNSNLLEIPYLPYDLSSPSRDGLMNPLYEWLNSEKDKQRQERQKREATGIDCLYSNSSQPD